MSSEYSPQSFLQKRVCSLPTFPQAFAKPLLCVGPWAPCLEEEGQRRILQAPPCCSPAGGGGGGAHTSTLACI